MMYNRTLTGYEKVWGPEHTSTLNTVNNLGLLYANQGRLKDADMMNKLALAGKKKAHSQHDPSQQIGDASNTSSDN